MRFGCFHGTLPSPRNFFTQSFLFACVPFAVVILALQLMDLMRLDQEARRPQLSMAILSMTCLKGLLTRSSLAFASRIVVALDPMPVAPRLQR